MPQKELIENGVKKLLIYVSVSCRDYSSGRIQLKKRVEGIEKNSAKANTIERELLREAEREKARRETEGNTWEVMLTKYDVYARDQLAKGDWCQGRQTYDEAIRALHNWTSEWYKEPAARIAASDITKLFHKMKEQGCSNAHICKIKGDIKKVFEFGILFDCIRGVKQSPTNGVSIKSRRRMRTEILREDEIRKLLSYAREYEPVWHYIWAFAVYTGCRNGELYSLKWTDINFQDRLITVQRSYNKKYKEEKCTKTEDWRYVSICAPLWEIILELKDIHDHDLKRGACKYPGYVLPRPGVWQNGEQARKLRMFCEEIGISPICFHTLRACFATELMRRKVDTPSIMRVGGWKSLKTMMHYIRLAGVQDIGITDPLDYRSTSPVEKNKRLMDAIGEAFSDDSVHEAKVIPLPTRSLRR